MGNEQPKRRNYNRSRRKKVKENYIPAYDPAILEIPIEELGLSPRTYNTLKTGKVLTVLDICTRRENEMYHVQGIGKKNIREIQEKLKKLGVDFRPSEIKDKPEDLKPNTEKSEKKKNNIVKTDDTKELLKRRPKRNIAKLEKRVSKSSKPIYDKDSYIKYEKNNLWGFKDINGKVLIEPQYDEVFDFSEDLAVVSKEDFYGYINKDGEIVIPIEYEMALSFSSGFAVVTKDEKSGYINKGGQVIIKPEYDIATYMSDGKALVRIDETWGFLDSDGNLDLKR